MLAAVPLLFLAGLSAVRVGLDFSYDYLIALGRTRAVMSLQALWLLALIPALVAGANLGGIRGAAIGHLVVAVGLMTPAFAFVLHRAGLPLRPVGRALRQPVAAAAAMALVVVATDHVITGDLQALLVGGALGGIVYGALAVPWWRGRAAIDGITEVVRGSSRN